MGGRIGPIGPISCWGTRISFTLATTITDDLRCIPVRDKHGDLMMIMWDLGPDCMQLQTCARCVIHFDKEGLTDAWTLDPMMPTGGLDTFSFVMRYLEFRKNGEWHQSMLDSRKRAKAAGYSQFEGVNLP